MSKKFKVKRKNVNLNQEDVFKEPYEGTKNHLGKIENELIELKNRVDKIEMDLFRHKILTFSKKDSIHNLINKKKK